MKIFTIIVSVLAIAIIVFSTTKLDIENLFIGESATAIMTIFCALCAIVLLQIFRVSKKIEKLNENKKA